MIEVVPGAVYKRTGRGRYFHPPGVREDYDRLLADLARQQALPRRIVHLWSLSDAAARTSLDERLDLSFFSLLFLAQAIGDQDLSDVDIAVVSDRLQAVGDEPVADPVAATLLGPVRVIPKELPSVTCRSIDVDLTSEGASRLAVQILAEHCSTFRNPVVAIREGERWVEEIEPADLRVGETASELRLKRGGVYLITGGLGDLGLGIAERAGTRLRSQAHPARPNCSSPDDRWDDALDGAESSGWVKERIRRLRTIKQTASAVTVYSCDVCDRDELRRTIDDVHAHFGAIDGVIHAAGMLDDGPLQLKSRESVNARPGPEGPRHPGARRGAKRGGLHKRMAAEVFRPLLLGELRDRSRRTGRLCRGQRVPRCLRSRTRSERRRGDQLGAVAGCRHGSPVPDHASACGPTPGRHTRRDRRRRAAEMTNGTGCSPSTASEAGKPLFLAPGTSKWLAPPSREARFERGVTFEDVFFVAPMLAERGQTKEVSVALRRAPKERIGSPSRPASRIGWSTPREALPDAPSRRRPIATSRPLRLAANPMLGPSMRRIVPIKRDSSISGPGGNASVDCASARGKRWPISIWRKRSPRTSPRIHCIPRSLTLPPVRPST